MTIELKIADEKDAEEWNKLVDISPHGTIFHTWKWLKIAEKYTSFKLYPIIGYKGTEPIGIFPLFYQRKALLKMVFSPPPHAAIPYLGPLLVEYDELKQNKKEDNLTGFQNSANLFIYKELRANYININLPLGLIDARPFIWGGYSADPNYHYSFDLSLGKSVLWQSLKKQTRKNIKNAVDKVELTEGKSTDLRFIYSSLERRYKEQNRVFGESFDYINDVYLNYSNNLQILMAKIDGEPIATLVNIFYKDKMLSWVGNAKTNLSGVYPNDLLMWKSIEYGCGEGYQIFYEIGANTPRLAQYKSNFNPSLVVGFTIKKSSPITKVIERAYSHTRNYIIGKWS